MEIRPWNCSHCRQSTNISEIIQSSESQIVDLSADQSGLKNHTQNDNDSDISWNKSGSDLVLITRTASASTDDARYSIGRLSADS